MSRYTRKQKNSRRPSLKSRLRSAQREFATEIAESGAVIKTLRHELEHTRALLADYRKADHESSRQNNRVA